MNNKHHMSQLNNIILVLKEHHKKEVGNLSKIQQVISRKTESVNRIIAYRAEYEKMNVNSMSVVVPALMKNMLGFIKKLDLAIVDEKSAIEKVEHERLQVANKVQELDRKIKALSAKFDTMRLNERINMENREAAMIDDMNVRTKSRDSA